MGRRLQKAVEMTDELQLAFEFYKEGELTVEELDEHYRITNAHL
jgi:peptide chain release factor 2